MKKLTVIIIALLCLMLLITGCGQSVPVENNTNTNQENNNDDTQENSNVTTPDNTTIEQENTNNEEQENISPATPDNTNNSSQESDNSTANNETPENTFNKLTLEDRMKRVLNDANEFTWNFDDGILSAKDDYIYSLIIRNYNNDFKGYISDTYIYEIPTSLNFDIELVQLNDGGYKFEIDGETYDFIYNSIFDEEIISQDVVEVYPFDPPLLDTELVSIDEIYANTYRITGTYDDMVGTYRIEVTVEYGGFGMIIKSVERFIEQSNETTEENPTASDTIFRIRELVDIPSDKPTFEFINPAYTDEPFDNLTKYIFDIDGYFKSVKLLTQESIGLEEEYDLDLESGDVVLVYYTMFPNDFANDVLIIKSTVSEYEYHLQLNDSVDRDLYLFEEK